MRFEGLKKVLNRVENFTPSYTICHYSPFFGQILVVRSGDLFNIGGDFVSFRPFWGEIGDFRGFWWLEWVI